MSIDQRLEDAYFDYSGERVRRGVLDCEMPREHETLDDFMRRKLREAGREVPE